MRRLAVAALAAACMSAHAVTPNIFEREPFQGWDWRKPLGELAMTNIVAGTDTWGKRVRRRVQRGQLQLPRSRVGRHYVER